MNSALLATLVSTAAQAVQFVTAILKDQWTHSVILKQASVVVNPV